MSERKEGRKGRASCHDQREGESDGIHKYSIGSKKPILFFFLFIASSLSQSGTQFIVKWPRDTQAGTRTFSFVTGKKGGLQQEEVCSLLA